ncbi:BatD family protein [candidate division FCPU426 bacterium]|nr:BatD family protein [candidate division FCPU426 bacterium]
MKSNRILFLGALCAVCVFSRLQAAAEEPPATSWESQKTKRTYSSTDETQKYLEQQVLENREDAGVELMTEPMPEMREEAGAEEKRPALAPTRSVHPQTGPVKRYGYQPAQEPLPVVNTKKRYFSQPGIQEEEQPESFEETEFRTQPLFGQETTLLPEGREIYSLKAELDQARVHLDESFTLTLEAVVADLQHLAPFSLPAYNDFTLINESQSESNTTINGRVYWVRTRQYVFVAKHPGEYTISSLSIFYAGKRHYTRKLQITVEGSRSGVSYTKPAGRAAYRQDGYVPGAPEVGSGKEENVEFFAEVSPQRVYINQQAIYTVRLQYTSDEQTALSYRPPALTGFLTEELPESKSEDRVSGAKQSYIEKQFRLALFPVRSGALQINVAEAVITKKSQSKNYVTEPMMLEVRPLPDDPQPLPVGNSGALVGQYQLTAALDTAETEMQTPVRLTVVVSGNGNLRGAAEPFLTEAGQHRIYLEDKQERVQAKKEGVRGERVYKYLVVFDKPGTMRLGEALMRFFDPETESWQTTGARIPAVRVAQRAHQPLPVQVQGKSEQPLNIRPYHSGAAVLRTYKPYAAVTPLFWVFQAMGPTLLGLVLLGKRWRAHLLRDAEVNRIRRAYATAKKSLRQMKRSMRKREDKIFYNGLAKTASDYLATKFEIPNVYIGTERLPEYFEHYQVPVKLQQRWKAALTACEYVRYAAVVLPDKDMWVLYRDVKVAIDDFEKYWNQRQRNKSGATQTAAGLLLLFSWLGAGIAGAGDAEVHFWRATTLAEKAEYTAAEQEFRLVIGMQVEDADVYYNLGNAYLQQGKLGAAVLAYQRGLRLAPRNADLKYNLRQAEVLVDNKRATPAHPDKENMIAAVYQGLTANEAVWLASFFYFIAVLIGMLVLLDAARFGRLRAAIFLCAALAAGLALWSLLRQFEPRWRKQAVVMMSQAETYNRPYANAEILFTIPEGTCVLVKSEEEAWIEVVDPLGRRGWTKRSLLGFIE